MVKFPGNDLAKMPIFSHHEVNDLDSLYNGICCRPWSAESRNENFISIRHLVAEISNVKVREINNFGNNFLFIFFIFVKVLLPIWRLTV